MAGPITWRTVQGASLADASRPMEVAQRSISAAFGGLESLVSDQQQLAQNRVDAGREANVQAFLERLQGAESVDAVNALKASGELDSLRNLLTPKDLVRVRGAEDNRAAALMQQTVAKRSFESGEAAAKYAPIKDQILASYLSGDPAQQSKAKQMLEANPGIPGMADMVKTMADFDAQQMQRNLTAQLNPLKIEEAKGNIAAAAARRDADAEARNLAKLQQEALNTRAALDAKMQLMKDTGNVYAEGVYDPSDAAQVSELFKASNLSPEKKAAMMSRLAKMAQGEELSYVDGNNKLAKLKVQLPLSMVKQAVLGAQDEVLPFFSGDAKHNTPFGWNEGAANNMEVNLRNGLKQFYQQDMGVDAKGKPLGSATQNKVVADYKHFMEVIKGKALNASFPVPSKK